MELNQLKHILEAILLSADHAMDLRKLEQLFEADEDRPNRDEIAQALQALQADYQGRGIELKEVATGFRMQVANDCAPWVSRLWEERAPKYSRALLETLVLIAYRQPITRGEIEEIRGVSVSSHIIKTLSERDWVRVLGHKDVPGKPSMYGTTREFLDYFNLKSLDELPSLADIADLDKLNPELALEPEVEPAGENNEADSEKAEGIETSEAETSESETSESETSESETSESETSESETSESETSESETSESETSEPETSEPETSEAETSEVETSESNTPENEPTEDSGALRVPQSLRDAEEAS